MFKKIIQRLRFWDRKRQRCRQEEPLQKLQAIYHFSPPLNLKMYMKHAKMNVESRP